MQRTLSRTAVALIAGSLASAALAQSCNTADRSVLLLLDASGSMTATLPNGEARIDVARRAVKGVAALLPPQTQIGLRLYGAQSPSSQKNCKDTALALKFGPASAAAAPIATTVDAAKAQGYTPIAFSLAEAANDFAATAKDRVIVLVSDGKETCDGDPLLAAKALATKGITVHTVGFVVDTAARGQLQAIAKATGGAYFDAPVGPELPDTLRQAFAACKTTVVSLPPRPEPGTLRTTSAVFPLPIFNAESGKQVASFDRVTTRVTLPAGVYEVRFGPSTWKGIEVKAGETTTIEPAELRIQPTADITVVDSETGAEAGKFDAVTPNITLMPGLYDLRFADTEMRFVKVDGGKTTMVDLARVRLASTVKWQNTARVVTSAGKEVFRFDAVTYTAVLPPGSYVIEIDTNKVPWVAAAGDTLELK
jgi:hypothetical protein